MSNNSENKSERVIIISERDNIAGVLENGKAMEFFIHRGDMLLGDVYLASVENILPSIDAAFVNLGGDRMGFLHASDVPGKGELKNRLEPKQKLLVQIIKEPTGHKGPRVTTSITLPGRFLVMMPEEKGISISRKILSPKERSRIKSIVSLLKPAGVGVIIRTEAENQTEEEIKEDMETLLEKWQNIVSTADTVEPPTLIHRDQDLLYRVIREACTDDVKEIFIDSPFGQHRVNQLVQTWNLGKNIKVTVHKGPDSLIVNKGLDKEIKSALQSKVNLPSGGYLYIQPTEALTVVDVNSGRFTSSTTQGETIRLTNLEAIDEIARQLRIRNVGGMIIVDFIDMDNRVDQLAILEAFEMALQPDKSKPQVGQLSDLGLVELTRHRQGQSLAEIFTKKCPACNGNGSVLEDLNFAPMSMEAEIKAKTMKGGRPVPRLKSQVHTAKQEINKTQKAIKTQQTRTVIARTQAANIAEGNKVVPSFKAKEIAEKTKPIPPKEKIEPRVSVSESPEIMLSEEGIYTKRENYRAIEDLSVDKLRKVFEIKKFYPEISKVVRFAGVPLKYAKDKFGEEVNMIDVFTILSEMEAAFARASASLSDVVKQTEVVIPIEQPDTPVIKEEQYIEDVKESFKGRYGISTEGEDFEEFEVVNGDDPKPGPVARQEVIKSDKADGEKSDDPENPSKSIKPARKPSRTTKKKPTRGRPRSK